MNITLMTQEQQTSKKKTATPAQSEDWDMLPDVEDLEKIVNRELEKLKEFERANTTEK
jgi:hypothetical protein